MGAIEAFHEQQGRYPEDLREAGLTESDIGTRFGNWQYRLREGASPEISAGHYEDNQFCLWWEFGDSTWYWDT